MVERAIDVPPVRLPHGVRRLPDGHTVPTPPHLGPPVTRGDLLCWGVCAAIVLAAPVAAWWLR